MSKQLMVSIKINKTVKLLVLKLVCIAIAISTFTIRVQVI